MSTIRMTAHYYQQFDADLSRDVPGEGYGGWQRAPVELSTAHTAVAVDLSIATVQFTGGAGAGVPGAGTTVPAAGTAAQIR